MQKIAKTLALVIDCLVGIGAVALLASMIQFAASTAEATPQLAKGKACNSCHTSSSPSKGDVKK